MFVFRSLAKYIVYKFEQITWRDVDKVLSMNNVEIFNHNTNYVIYSRYLYPMHLNDLISMISIKIMIYQEPDFELLKQINNILTSKFLFKKPYLIEKILLKNSDFYYFDYRVFKKNKLTNKPELYCSLDYEYIKQLNAQFKYIKLGRYI